MRTLNRAHRKALPKQFKKVMTTALGNGTVAYGASFVNQTDDQWKALRSASVQCLGRSCSGANPWLALSVCGSVCDPQLADLLRKIKFGRSFLHFHPWERSFFYKKLIMESTRKVGPTAVFRFALQRVGWVVMPNGFIQHYCGLKLNWACDSIKHIRTILHAAWACEVSARVQHRQAFDIQCFDSQIFAKSLKKFNARDQGSLLALASGKNVTKNILSKYCKTIKDDRCPFCDAVDTKRHRVFKCSEFRSEREAFPKLFACLETLPQAFWNYGLASTNWGGWTLKQEITAVLPPFRAPLPSDRVVIFTDGTAVGVHFECRCCYCGQTGRG